jgi:uncharacterized protein (DUF2062 family)
MPRKWFKRYLPDPATLAANRWLAWMGPRLHDPQLWTLHRRNVARAVAVGLFAGLMPGPTQMRIVQAWAHPGQPAVGGQGGRVGQITFEPLARHGDLSRKG